jgi:hypothetical protein
VLRGRAPSRELYDAGAAAGGSGACGVVVEGLRRVKRTPLKTTIHTRLTMGETNRVIAERRHC